MPIVFQKLKKIELFVLRYLKQHLSFISDGQFRGLILSLVPNTEYFHMGLTHIGTDHLLMIISFLTVHPWQDSTSAHGPAYKDLPWHSHRLNWRQSKDAKYKKKNLFLRW